MLDAGALAGHAATTMSAARAVAVATGIELRLVDMGGGLGIPYAPGTPPLDLAAFGAALRDLDKEWASDPVTRTARVIVEPGRYLVARAGAFVSRVVDRKCADGATVVILDGGIHHVLRPALVGQEHRIVALGPARRGRPERVVVAGPLCSGLDVLARGLRMVPPEVGDLLAVLDVGAYGFTESMPLFLSHPIPAEVAIRDGRAALIRPTRGTVDLARAPDHARVVTDLRGRAGPRTWSRSRWSADRRWRRGVRRTTPSRAASSPCR